MAVEGYKRERPRDCDQWFLQSTNAAVALKTPGSTGWGLEAYHREAHKRWVVAQGQRHSLEGARCMALDWHYTGEVAAAGHMMAVDHMEAEAVAAGCNKNPDLDTGLLEDTL